MKRLSFVVGALLVSLAAAPAASARTDAYYTVVCDGVSYESVDAHAIEQGGKEDAVAHFGEKHGMDCRLDGPFEQ
ncbi:MAG: hypothetical protein ACJ765_04990 [Chloroflexota bacterium]